MIRHIPHRFSGLTMKAHNAPGLTEVLNAPKIAMAISASANSARLVMSCLEDVGRETHRLPAART